MKPKDYCQNCGKYICKKKLKRSPKDNRLLCANCFKEEFGIKPIYPPIIKNIGNLSEKEKNTLRIDEIRRKCNYIDRSDIDFLINKYKSKNYKKINKLFKYLGTHRTRDILDNSESLDRQKREEIMKKFLKGLK